MAVFAKPTELRRSLRRYVPDFERLYRFHSLPVGGPEDFCRMTERLTSNEGFRLDLSSLVRVVRDMDGGAMTATEMLTLAAMASGGEAIGEAEGPEVDEAAGRLSLLLAEVGEWREPEPGLKSEVSQGRSEAVVVPDLGGQISPAESRDGDAASASGSGLEISSEVKEMLERLELANMQLKVYLDDIDRRIGRIEPRLEEITSRAKLPVESGEHLLPERGPDFESQVSEGATSPKQVEEVRLSEEPGRRAPGEEAVIDQTGLAGTKTARQRRSLAEVIADRAEAARMEGDLCCFPVEEVELAPAAEPAGSGALTAVPPGTESRLMETKDRKAMVRRKPEDSGM